MNVMSKTEMANILLEDLGDVIALENKIIRINIGKNK